MIHYSSLGSYPCLLVPYCDWWWWWPVVQRNDHAVELRYCMLCLASDHTQQGQGLFDPRHETCSKQTELTGQYESLKCCFCFKDSLVLSCLVLFYATVDLVERDIHTKRDKTRDVGNCDKSERKCLIKSDFPFQIHQDTLAFTSPHSCVVHGCRSHCSYKHLNILVASSTYQRTRSRASTRHGCLRGALMYWAVKPQQSVVTPSGEDYPSNTLWLETGT